MHDIQSGLATVYWWAGTTPQGSDIFPEEMSPSHTVLQKTLSTGLSEGTTVYVTLGVCNKAGERSIRSLL